MTDQKSPPPEEQRDSINPESRPTPGSAEGEREDVEETLDAPKPQKQ